MTIVTYWWLTTWAPLVFFFATICPDPCHLHIKKIDLVKIQAYCRGTMKFYVGCQLFTNFSI